MKRYMLDTNTVSHLIKGHPAVGARVQAAPMAALCISAITEGELQFGLAKRPDAKRLRHAVNEFLKRVDVLPWDRTVAARYGALRAAMERQGQSMAPLDLLIAGHALSAAAALVTHDAAFAKVPQLDLEDWTQASGVTLS
jgi:tRNA(fMet)-specific endonuclease VapC